MPAELAFVPLNSRADSWNKNPVADLLNPAKLWSREAVLARACPVPKDPGVYAWYSREAPLGVPTEECRKYGAYTLLYVGIAPKAPPRNGTRPHEVRPVLQRRLRVEEPAAA